MHAHYGLSGVVALAAPRRIPLVLTVHGRDCHHPVVKRLTGLVARRAAAVVAVSEELAGRRPFPVAAVIPPGVDLERFRPIPRREARARLGLDVRRAAPASFRPTRGAPRRFADARELVERLAAAGLDVELRAVCGRPRAEMPLWLNAADAVVITSEREGYGLACVEALACDVPVLSTPVGVAPALLAGLEGACARPSTRRRWGEHLAAVLAAARAPGSRTRRRGDSGSPRNGASYAELYRKIRPA